MIISKVSTKSLFSKGMGFLFLAPYDLRLGVLCSSEEGGRKCITV